MRLPTAIGATSIHPDPDAYEADAPAAVTLGRFDGVHMGHQALLRATAESAARLPRGRALAVTFWPPPEQVLRPQTPLRLLTTLSDRLALLAEAGVSDVIVWPFDRELAALTPAEFVERLAAVLDMRILVTGPNARIGKDRAGTPDVIGRIACEIGIEYRQIEWHQAPESIASSSIRDALARGHIESANRALGRWFSLAGRVVGGDARGRELGYPTVNLELPASQLLPGDGVYAGVVAPSPATARRGWWPAVANIGVRPTFGAGERLVEAHLLDFDGDLYDRSVRLFFQRRLRAELTFESVSELVDAIGRDVEAARALPDPPAGVLRPFVRS